jgi:crotonobetainyl-CoA:carnitine CoA-transferase CaiB-like acyl-CoA transferase
MLLQGYKVVELATFIAGPAAAGMMGDWGADVIKIEGLTGDAIRWVRPELRPDIPPNFEIDNHGKRAIALDYSKPEGRAIVLDLIRNADVFVTSVRQSSLARAGFDFATLHQLNPGLVYASVSGYGLEGPAAELNAFDLTAFWSRSGIGGQMFRPNEMPSSAPIGVGDHVTAISLALGVMTALLERSKSGKGRLVEASLLRTGVYAGSYAISEYARRAVTLPPQSRAEAETTGFFQSQEGRWFSFYPNNPARDWPTVFAAANRSEWEDDPRFSTAEGRNANNRALKDALDTAFSERPMTAIAEVLNERGLTWSPVQSVADVIEDPFVAAAGCFISVDDGAGGEFQVAGPPVRFPGEASRRAGIVPRVGEHTDELLLELGRTEAEIRALKSAGVVRGLEV